MGNLIAQQFSLFLFFLSLNWGPGGGIWQGHFLILHFPQFSDGTGLKK